MLEWALDRCTVRTRYRAFEEELVVERHTPRVSPLYHPVDQRVRDLSFSYGDSRWTLVTEAAAATYEATANQQTVVVVEVGRAESAFEQDAPELAVLGVLPNVELGRWLGELLLDRLCRADAICVARLVPRSDNDQVVLIVHVRADGERVLLPTAGWAYLLEQQ